jgi:ADP-ribose pyrophosphatase
VRQYRAAIESDLLEIPAGIRDVEGEPPEETARRELAEEVGMTAGHVERLGEYLPAAGFTDQRTHLFVATDLTPGDVTAHGVEEEYMTIEQMPMADAHGRIASGDIQDGKTIIALLLTERLLAGDGGGLGGGPTGRGWPAAG